jgi:protein involved in polysaccharide export with SLBB domain
LSFNSLGRLSSFFGLLTASLLLAGCGSLLGTKPSPQPVANTQLSGDSVAVKSSEDPLRVGDKVKIELTGITALRDADRPNEQAIKEDGTITLTFLGSVQAAGKTAKQLETDIHDQYVPKYYKQLTVAVTPLDRFFYVGGQVNRPNQQLYVGSVTVSKAIQAAGDFTDFADRKHIQITRVQGKVEFVNFYEILKHPELDMPIYPGDTINVDRRW